jgi:Na+/glutamate symporter
MMHHTPIHTFWSIIGMTALALAITRILDVPGEKAMPIFIACMFLGVPLGELLERLSKRSKAK